MKGLVLGHGPSLEKLKDLDLSYYDLIVTCHDDCGLFQIDKDFKCFHVVTVDNFDKDKNEIAYYRSLGITANYIWNDVHNTCKCYSGMGAIEYAIKKGCVIIDSLGLDWTYCNDSQLSSVKDAFKYLFNKYDFIYNKL